MEKFTPLYTPLQRLAAFIVNNAVEEHASIETLLLKILCCHRVTLNPIYFPSSLSCLHNDFETETIMGSSVISVTKFPVTGKCRLGLMSTAKVKKKALMLG